MKEHSYFMKFKSPEFGFRFPSSLHALLNYAQPAHNVGGLLIHWTAA